MKLLQQLETDLVSESAGVTEKSPTDALVIKFAIGGAVVLILIFTIIWATSGKNGAPPSRIAGNPPVIDSNPSKPNPKPKAPTKEETTDANNGKKNEATNPEKKQDAAPEPKQRPVRVVIDASRRSGIWWSKQFGPDYDASKPHQGQKFANYLKSLGWEVDELYGKRKLSEAFADADFVVRFGLGRRSSYTSEEVDAYEEFVRGGGKLLLLGGGRGAPMKDSVADAFGVQFDTFIHGEVIQHWSDDPITLGLPKIVIPSGSIVTQVPDNAKPLGWLDQNREKNVMGSFDFGDGHVVYLSTEIIFIIRMPRKLCLRIFQALALEPQPNNGASTE